MCGTTDSALVLRSPRLDGPLVRCRDCGLLYVAERERDYTFSGADPERTRALGARVTELGIVERDVEAAEAPWRSSAERARVDVLRRHLESGRLLDIGSATGAFLAAAGAYFLAQGLEPDPGTSEQARQAGLDVVTGALDTFAAPPQPFDAVTMIHVIEHLDSPRAALERARELLRPGGVLMIETPAVDNLWFRLAPRRWRQLIPDHYFFFSRRTLERLLRETGFTPVEHRRPGRRVSVRFAADRLRRAGFPGAGGMARLASLPGVGSRTVYLNPGDIMQVIATAD